MVRSNPAMLWMVLRCLLLTLIPAVTHVTAAHVNIYVIAFIHSVSSFLFLLPWVFRQGVASIVTSRLPLHVTRGGLSTLALVAWSYALAAMPYAEAVSLSFIWALCSMVLAALWFKERLSRHAALALLGGMVGAGIMVMPGSGLPWPASLWAIGAVLIWSVTDIIIKMLTMTEQSRAQCFYITLCMSIFTLPLAITHWQMPAFSHLFYLVAQGAMFALNMVAVSYAYRARLCDIMPLDFSRLLFMTGISFFILHEPLTLPTIAGSVCILCSTMYGVMAAKTA